LDLPLISPIGGFSRTCLTRRSMYVADRTSQP